MFPPLCRLNRSRSPELQPALSVEPLERRRLLSVVTGFGQSTFVSGLDFPTQMEFAPDGRLFVSQQGGALRVIKDGQLLPTPFATLPVDYEGERGLLGVTFDPDFTTNHYVYVYWTNPSPSPHNQVSRFTASGGPDGDVAAPGSEVDLFDLPALSSAGNHNGGAIHFGADGKLYIAVGENAHPAYAQSLDTPLGKLLRINADGSIPADDPFYSQTTGPARAIWAMGLRNPYTFAVQPGTGRIFIDDVGQNDWEEIDDGAAGANYGWPITEGDAQPREQTPANYRDPVYTYPHGPNESQGVAITAGTFYDPPAGAASPFPASYAGDYFFADYGLGFVRSLDLKSGSATTSYTAAAFATGLNHPTDMKTGPDGSLYVLEHGTNDIDGAVVRFSPQSGAVSPTPTPTPTPAPTPTPSPTPVPTVPADVIGSLEGAPESAVQSSRGEVVARLTNEGGALASGRVRIQLFLSADAALDGSDTSLLKSSRNIHLAAGAAETLPLRFRFPSRTSPGAYYLLAKIDLQGGASDVVVSPSPVSVEAPSINLTGSFLTTPTTVTPGRLARAILNVTNTGNSAASGPVAIVMSATTNAAGENVTAALPTMTRHIRLPAGASVRLRLSFVVPKKLAAGTYYLSSEISPRGRLVESNDADNLAVGPIPFTAS